MDYHKDFVEIEEVDTHLCCSIVCLAKEGFDSNVQTDVRRPDTQALYLSQRKPLSLLYRPGWYSLVIEDGDRGHCHSRQTTLLAVYKHIDLIWKGQRCQNVRPSHHSVERDSSVLRKGHYATPRGRLHCHADRSCTADWKVDRIEVEGLVDGHSCLHTTRAIERVLICPLISLQGQLCAHHGSL